MIHVVPVEDDRPHDLDQDCWCGPTADDGPTLVHHAADLREAYEQATGEPHPENKGWATVAD